MSDELTAFIGGGNMARSLIGGLVGAGYPIAALRASDPDPGCRDAVAALGVRALEDNAAAITGATTVVLAVKPQMMREVVAALPLSPDQLIVSIAAGVPLAALENWARPGQPIVRCMPNTPALLGAGITALYANPAASAPERERAERILAAAGQTLWLDRESDIDAVTAVSGSGPAYFFFLMEAMIEAGQALGLSAETARTLTLETARGAARMAREGTDTPSELRMKVTSPGGTTAAALGVLEDAGVSAIIRAALTRAAQRSQELAEEFGAS